MTPATKADLRRAVIRTAARTHWQHNFTGRVTPRPCRCGEHQCDCPALFRMGCA